MDTQEYVKNAIKTESQDFEAIGARMSEVQNQRLLHAGFPRQCRPRFCPCPDSGRISIAVRSMLRSFATR